MDILYEDSRILVCIKPAGVLSAGDEPGGMVDLLRKELGDEHACVRSVHRLDAQVSGLMVFALVPSGRRNFIRTGARACV